MKLPDSFKDFAAKHIGGKGPDKVFLAHYNQEMYHAQWKIVLDNKFIDTYEHGIIIECLDGLSCNYSKQRTEAMPPMHNSQV
ncbi:hypothetical protein DXG01_002237 [Tephrocybe rancida]|nr:hypothetical protein DXG01_002237 [Tephrocybe rancida]